MNRVPCAIHRSEMAGTVDELILDVRGSFRGSTSNDRGINRRIRTPRVIYGMWGESASSANSANVGIVTEFTSEDLCFGAAHNHSSVLPSNSMSDVT